MSNSWMSNATFSQNNCSTPSAQTSTPGEASPFQILPSDLTEVEQITDENSLSQYLKDYEAYEKANTLSCTVNHSANLLSSFWSHPSTKTTKDAVAFLKKNVYQMATQSPGKNMFIYEKLGC